MTGFAPVLRPACLAAALAVAVAAPASAQDVDFKRGVLEHLVQYIGTYNFEAVLRDPAVASRIDAHLGAQAADLPDLLRIHGPIDFIEGNLVLDGRAPYDPLDGVPESLYREEVSIWVGIHSGLVAIVPLQRGEITVHYEKWHTAPWRWRFRQTVRDIDGGIADIELPGNVTWFHDGVQVSPP